MQQLLQQGTVDVTISNASDVRPLSLRRILGSRPIRGLHHTLLTRRLRAPINQVQNKVQAAANARVSVLLTISVAWGSTT